MTTAQPNASAAPLHVTLPDGADIGMPAGSTALDLARRISERLAREALAAEIDGKVVDLSTPLREAARVKIVTFNDPEGIDVFRHSSAHLMAQAVTELFPDARPTIGPVVAEGFYYDFDHAPFSEKDLERIEQRMAEIVARKLPVQRIEMSRQEALAAFRDNKFKVEMIEDLPEGSITAYRQGEFVDLCRGPHVQHTGQLKHFKLLKVAGAFWRGDAAREQLQRVYGISFADGKALEAHLTMLEEAARRDHRRIGQEMDLFSFHPEGPGFPFWHPRGLILREELVRFWREAHRRHGYAEVGTPTMLSVRLWEQSGHLDNYKENMYFTSIEDAQFAIKPMNCPGGILIYRDRRHSYRELPLRWGELGLVHRHELSGVLHGLFRVRAFTQDDAHLFCTEEQVLDEVVGILKLVAEMYGTCGFSDYRVELSTRPAKRIGSDAMWDLTEGTLRDALDRQGLPFQINAGDGAFYGPKIDFHIRDSVGRTWQCGTVQMDMALPERFDLTYEAADGSRKRPVMIHRTVLGSLERFLGILTEHFEGKFPLWLSPEQARVLPVSDRFLDYGRRCQQALFAAGLRAELDERAEKIGRKVRDAQVQRVNYQLVVGEREAADGTVSVRTRGGKQLGALPLDAFIALCRDEIAARRLTEAAEPAAAPGEARP